MKQLIPAIVLAATAVTVQAETVTVIDGTPQGLLECHSLRRELGIHNKVQRAGIDLYRKDNRFIQVECQTLTDNGSKWNPGKVVVYTPAEVVQLEEAYVIKQRQSDDQRAREKAELLKKYGI